MKHKGRVKKIRSITFSLWRSFTVFAVILVLAVTVILFLIMGETYSSRSRDRLMTVGTEICEYLGSAPDGEDAGEYIAGCESRYFVKVYVFGDGYADGDTPLYAVGTGESDLTGIYESAEEKCALSQPGEYFIYSYDSDTLSFAAHTDYGGGSIVVIHFSTFVAQATSRIAGIYLIIMCLVAILIAFLLSYLISTGLSRPIKNITQSADELARGNYDVTFDSAQYSELAQLSDSLNCMAGEVKKSDDFQKELLANVSHDLKTPLTMIKAYASMIKEISGDDPEKREKNLDVIIEETDRLTEMINDVLKVSKIGADNKMDMEVFSLTDSVYGIVEKFDYLQDTQGYNIMVDIDHNVFTLADREKIEEALYNLVSNAVNYTGEDKTIFVRLEDDPVGGRAKFSVRDTGKGISGEDMRNIWNRFYRSKETHSRPVKGTGLGLSIVKLILERHRFDFGVESKPGEGSTFWVDFPSVEPPEENGKRGGPEDGDETDM